MISFNDWYTLYYIVSQEIITKRYVVYMRKKVFSDIISDFKLLGVLLLPSIFIIIKFSHAPACFSFMLPLLQCPNIDSIQYNILEILNTLSISYISSLIFYVITIYYPNKNVEVREFNLIKQKLEYIYELMCDILAFFKFSLGVKDFEDISPDIKKEIDNFSFPSSGTFLTRISTGGNTTQNRLIEFCVYEKKIISLGSQLDATLVQALSMIDSSPSRHALTGLLKKIKFSSLMNTITKVMSKPVPGNISFSYIDLSSNLHDFSILFNKFKVYNFKKYNIYYCLSSDEEIQSYIKSQREIFSNYPEIIKVMQELHMQ